MHQIYGISTTSETVMFVQCIVCARLTVWSQRLTPLNYNLCGARSCSTQNKPLRLQVPIDWKQNVIACIQAAAHYFRDSRANFLTHPFFNYFRHLYSFIILPLSPV